LLHTSDHVLVALRRIIRAIDVHSRRLVHLYGLTGPQLIVLQEVVRRGTASITELARAAKLSTATVTGIVTRLETRALVVRVRSTVDKRRVDVSPTDGARAVLEQAPTPLQQRFLVSFEQLADWEQTLILSSLQRVAAMMDADELAAEPLLTTDVAPQGAFEGFAMLDGPVETGATVSSKPRRSRRRNR